jgi:hypothetical protein
LEKLSGKWWVKLRDAQHEQEESLPILFWTHRETARLGENFLYLAIPSLMPFPELVRLQFAETNG